ncbi:MAG: methylated-DNA--[Lachnospiraceae bacterium]|nr:methylated-DNA--[protein]-cysteine S-methyltransferase [Lachnospiraceae bacterium]
SGYLSPLGPMTMTGDEEALTGLWFDGQRYYAAGRKKTEIKTDNRQMKTDLPVFEQTGRWLDLYFAGKDPGFVPPVRLEGTAFRKAVWEILQQIPYGQTMTYGQIAEQIASERGIVRMSAQAVGGAVGHNPVSIIVPCHRVLGAGGSLTGYGGGLDRKKALLELEKIDYMEGQNEQISAEYRG